uniref:dual-specificity kinase n=1 Tax=Hippocampus comes TaxID=109280 RepID=A0A3Q2Y438_HIPCM
MDTGRHHHASRQHRAVARRRRRSREAAAADADRDTENGHLAYKKGDVLEDRYEILDTLGEGTFGKVVQCLDHKRSGRQIALKIIKNIEKYREAAKLEINVLEKITRRPQSVCSMLDWFTYYGHICISFELLSVSTFDFQKGNNFLPYPIHHIRHMAQQICRAGSFLHDNRLTHTDLKPENILFVNSDYSVIYNADKCSKSGRYVKAKCKPLQKYLLSQGREHHQFFDLLERMLEYEPSKRISLSSALSHPFFLQPQKSARSQTPRNSYNMGR